MEEVEDALVAFIHFLDRFDRGRALVSSLRAEQHFPWVDGSDREDE